MMSRARASPSGSVTMMKLPTLINRFRKPGQRVQVQPVGHDLQGGGADLEVDQSAVGVEGDDVSHGLQPRFGRCKWWAGAGGFSVLWGAGSAAEQGRAI
jgi:hypothetical protein